MNEAQRHKKLLDYLKTHRTIATADYVKHFDVSLSTARRDIIKLAETGKLLKIRNGAEYIPEDEPASKSVSDILLPSADSIPNYEEKLRIAEAASKLCAGEDSVVIGGSHTTLLLAEFIPDYSVQVVTNYLPIVNKLLTKSHTNIVILGGQYLPELQITMYSDEEKEDVFKSRYAFISGSGMTENGVYTTDFLENLTKKRLMEYGDRLVVMMDSSKLNKRSGKLLAGIDRIDTLITGKEADPEFLETLRSTGLNVIVA